MLQLLSLCYDYYNQCWFLLDDFLISFIAFFFILCPAATADEWALQQTIMKKVSCWFTSDYEQPFVYYECKWNSIHSAAYNFYYSPKYPNGGLFVKSVCNKVEGTGLVFQRIHLKIILLHRSVYEKTIIFLNLLLLNTSSEANGSSHL